MNFTEGKIREDLMLLLSNLFRVNVNAWTQVKWHLSIESRTVSKFPGFVWITVVQEMEEKFGNNSSKLAEQNKEKKSNLNTK